MSQDLLEQPTEEHDLGEDRPDPSAPLVASGNLRRRLIIDRFVQSTASLSAVLAIAVLVIVVYEVVKEGGSALSWDFITQAPVPFGSGGGIGPAIVGSAIVVGLATAMAAPIGILIAVYLVEYAKAGRFSNALRLVLDLLNGTPSIVIAVFAFGLLVAGHGQSGFAGAFALAIIMVPLIARSSQEVLLLVPRGMLDAADALGVARWRKITGVLLPVATGGILTGTVLAVARAAGETAPMLVLNSIYAPGFQLNPFGHTVPNIPFTIFNLSEQGGADNNAKAWGAALILLTAILIANVLSRWALARSRRKMGL